MVLESVVDQAQNQECGNDFTVCRTVKEWFYRLAWQIMCLCSVKADLFTLMHLCTFWNLPVFFFFFKTPKWLTNVGLVSEGYYCAWNFISFFFFFLKRLLDFFFLSQNRLFLPWSMLRTLTWWKMKVQSFWSFDRSARTWHADLLPFILYTWKREDVQTVLNFVLWCLT